MMESQAFAIDGATANVVHGDLDLHFNLTNFKM